MRVGRSGLDRAPADGLVLQVSDGAAALLAAAVRADLRVATFSRAASDLEELFLQVTAQEPVGSGVVA